MWSWEIGNWIWWLVGGCLSIKSRKFYAEDRSFKLVDRSGQVWFENFGYLVKWIDPVHRAIDPPFGNSLFHFSSHCFGVCSIFRHPFDIRGLFPHRYDEWLSPNPNKTKSLMFRGIPFCSRWSGGLNDKNIAAYFLRRSSIPSFTVLRINGPDLVLII